MVDELVDLCNSDNDDVVVLPARNNSNNSINDQNKNDDDSSSSSSSEDSYLWKVDVPKGSPPKEDVRRGNYFKEIRKKYKDDDDNSSKRKQTKRQKIFHAVGSSNADGDGEDFDVNNVQRNNDYDKSGSRMKLSPPLVSDIGKQSSLSKQSSMTKQQSSLKNLSQDSNKDMDCIEIDSSSDDYDTRGINRTATIVAKKDHIPCKNNNSQMKKKSYDCSSNDDDDSIYSTKLCREKKKSIAMTKCGEATSNDVSGLEHSNYSSQSTDSTVSLPTEMMSPEMEEYKKLSIQEKKKKFDASLNNTDDNNTDDIEHVNDDLRGMDNSFDSFGRFDEDDDQLMRKGNNKSQSSNKMESKSKAKPKSYMNDEIELLDDSSENSVNSESSAELFTPRFKKQATKPAALNPERYTTTANSSESGLSTPRAFSPATTSPTMGAYATKRKVPTPAIPAMPAALVREIGGK
jgi:hypothetical protein